MGLRAIDPIDSEKLDNFYNDFPLTLKKLRFKKACYQVTEKRLQISIKFQLKKIKKIGPNLHNEDKYLLYHRNLQLYLQLGMKLTKIHSS